MDIGHEVSLVRVVIQEVLGSEHLERLTYRRATYA